MENPSNETSGGSTAQTPNSNLNPATACDITADHAAHVIPPQFDSDDPIPLRELSERFNCSLHSLKSNTKANRLPSMKGFGTAPYLVKPSDAEQFLRKTPDIKSIFYPGTDTRNKEPASTAAGIGPKVETSSSGAASESQSATVKGQPTPPRRTDTPAVTPEPAAAKVEALPPASNAPPGKKKRRRRGKGKGGSFPGANVASPIPGLSKLAGLTDGERSKLAAVLNELLGLVLPS